MNRKKIDRREELERLLAGHISLDEFKEKVKLPGCIVASTLKGYAFREEVRPGDYVRVMDTGEVMTNEEFSKVCDRYESSFLFVTPEGADPLF